MNCDQCKEQVLELIDRERTDPQAVHEILGRCPECRALFEETKATLELAATLPLDDPPRALDEAVLEAARAHATRVVPIERARFRPVPWAAAAVALLAVSVGVWSIPETTEGPAIEAEPESIAAVADNDAVVAEVAEVGELAALEEALEPMEPAAPQVKTSAPKAARSAAVPPKKRRSEKQALAKRGARADEDSPRASEEVGFAADQAAGAPAASAPARDVESDQKEAAPLSAKCKKRLVAVETGARETSGEDALFLGRCYRDAEDFDEARRWFERAAADPKTRARATRALDGLQTD